MSTKETPTIENPFHVYAETTQETLKGFWGWQMKAGQSLLDQSLRYAQTYCDFVQTQMQEGTRLSQEVMKMSLSNANELKKTFNASTK